MIQLSSCDRAGDGAVHRTREHPPGAAHAGCGALRCWLLHLWQPCGSAAAAWPPADRASPSVSLSAAHSSCNLPHLQATANMRLCCSACCSGKRPTDAHLCAPLLTCFRICSAACLQACNVLPAILRLLLQRQVLAAVQRLELLLCLSMLLPNLSTTEHL